MSTKLPEIIKKSIGNEEINAVDARQLHDLLGSRQEFANWIKGRITYLGLTEHEDYEILLDKPIKQVHGGHNRRDYALSLDTAKHIAMAERTDKGKEIRSYFISVEKEYTKITTPVRPLNAVESACKSLKSWVDIAALYDTPRHIALIEATKYNHENFGVDASNLLKASPFMENIQKEEMFLEVTEVAKVVGMKSGIAVNRRLEELGLQVKESGSWKPTTVGAEHSLRNSWKSGSKSGYNFKWNVEFCKKVLGGQDD